MDGPKILNDLSRLQEIYDLRVVAYENSHKANYINRTIFPNGWKDSLDEQAIHWIIENEGKIIASARIVVLDNLDDTEQDLETFDLPIQRPFAYFSRLVVHPKYSKMGASELLDMIRIKYFLEHDIAFMLAYAFSDRKAALLKRGFKELGGLDYKWSNGAITSKQSLFIYTNGTQSPVVLG